jgi:hypothetical protein
MTAAYNMFRGKDIRPLGFSHRGELIDERAASEGGPGRLTPWWRGLRKASIKIEGWAFISSNSKNISCVAFLKYKNSRK